MINAEEAIKKVEEQKILYAREFEIKYPVITNKINQAINDATQLLQYSCSLFIGKDEYAPTDPDHFKSAVKSFLVSLGYTCTPGNWNDIYIPWNIK